MIAGSLNPIMLGQISSSTPLLLDAYSGAAVAYGMRKLRTAYSGSAIRIRRSSDNTEQDIGFDGSGNLDTAAISSFVGADSAYVKTWYDQSGNGVNATQSTQSAQPTIVSSGSILTKGSRPTMLMGGAAWLVTGSVSVNLASIFSAFSPVGTGVYNYICRINATPESAFRTSFTPNSRSMQFYRIGSQNFTSSANVWNANTFYLADAHGTSNCYLNDTQVISGLAMSTSLSTGNIYIGIANGSVEYSNMYISELIMYNTSNHSNRAEFSTNIRTYYGI